MKDNWTPGQKLFVAVDPEWDSYYDEAPEVDEECIWYVIQTTLKEREVLVLELRFGRRGHPLTLAEAGKILPRRSGGIGVSREMAREVEAKALRKLRHPSRYKLLQEVASAETREKSERAWEMRKKELQNLGVNF